MSDTVNIRFLLIRLHTNLKFSWFSFPYFSSLNWTVNRAEREGPLCIGDISKGGSQVHQPGDWTWGTGVHLNALHLTSLQLQWSVWEKMSLVTGWTVSVLWTAIGKRRKGKLIIEVTIFYWHSVSTYLHSTFSINGTIQWIEASEFVMFIDREQEPTLNRLTTLKPGRETSDNIPRILLKEGKLHIHPLDTMLISNKFWRLPSLHS